MAVFAAIFRQAYLRKGLSALMLCLTLAMVLYELAVFGFCLLLGQVTVGKYMCFLVPAVSSIAVVPVIYPFVKSIHGIGGVAWNE